MLNLGGHEITLELPRMAVRYRLLGAWSSLGTSPSGIDAAMVCSAAIGLCWSGRNGPPTRLEEHRRDVVAYGEAVFEWLLGQGVPFGDIAAAIPAVAAHVERIAESLPREEAVQAAADPTGATGGSSTPSSSALEPSGSGIPSTSTG